MNSKAMFYGVNIAPRPMGLRIVITFFFFVAGWACAYPKTSLVAETVALLAVAAFLAEAATLEAAQKAAHLIDSF